ncbi:serine/threonine-protein kinase [Mycolicibacterium sphagni]
MCSIRVTYSEVAESTTTPTTTRLVPLVRTCSPRTCTPAEYKLMRRRPGELVANRYHLRRPLGTGTYGEVWEARDTHLGHDVALKLMHHQDKSTTWREAHLLTALRSEHILEVHNADAEFDVPYLDTALAACSLDAVMAPYGIEPTRAVDYVRRALRGLELCHRSQLLHRDIKPANLFLSIGGDALLGDFGIASVMDSNGFAEAGGDIRIRAPELHGGGGTSIRSDIYSMSVTLYALLAGRMPFGQQYEADLIAAVQAGQYPHLRDIAPHVGRALADKVRKGMSVDPHSRYASAGEFDNALAIPVDARKFTPAAVDGDELRAWSGTGKGVDLRVSLRPSSRPRQYRIDTVGVRTNRRLLEHCGDIRERDAPTRLRRIFDGLRH